MVIVILGILAAVAIPKFIDLRKDAQKAACKGSGAAIQTAISNYYARQAIAGTEGTVFPSTLHDASFLYYLSGDTLPPNNFGNDWDDYYDSSSGNLNVDSACTG